jgi:Fucose-binding lectin II (PA-IIL)
MTWTVNVINNSPNVVVTQSSANRYVETELALVAVVNVGSIFLLDVGHQPSGPHYWAVRVTTGTGYNQLWWYDGDGACTLTINADNTFTLTGQGQTLPSAPIAPPYLPVIDLPTGTEITVNAFTNASYLQRLAIAVNNFTGVKQWSGTGEGNVPIATNSRFTTPGAPGGTVKAALSIDYSPDNGATWGHSNISPASRCAVHRFNQVIFASEDSLDNDWNDMTVLLSWWSPQ